MKSVIQKVLTASAPAVFAALCLAGCGQGGHDHDADADHGHPHPHSQRDANDTTASLSEEDLATQRTAYPMKVCLVEGEELGSMGEPAEYLHEGRLVLFCCKGCTEGFQEDPAKYLARLDEALEAVSSSGAEE